MALSEGKGSCETRQLIGEHEAMSSEMASTKGVRLKSDINTNKARYSLETKDYLKKPSTQA